MPPRPATTLPSLRTHVDFSALHALRARRAAREPHTSEKLALLRPLAKHTVFGTLSETRVEQSWNEQLFAKVLGYRTLLSHDALPFNILPKNIADRHHFDDFSLGFFGADDSGARLGVSRQGWLGLHRAIAELASCLCELAVQFRAARGGVGLSHQQLTTWFERALARA